MLPHISAAILRPFGAYCLRGKIKAGGLASEFAGTGISLGRPRLSHKRGCSMSVKRNAKRITGILLVCTAPVMVGGCVAVAVAGTVVGAGVSVASAVVDVGVAVGSTAVSATTGVVKAVIP
jgi:hypothetical protein